MPDPVIVSQSTAKHLGLQHYFTGIPCKNGHISIRFTKYGNCADCQTEGARRRYNASETIRKEKLAANKVWAKNNPEKMREYSKEWKDAHPEYATRARELRRVPERRGKDLEYNRRWRDANRIRVRELISRSAKRRREKDPEKERNRGRETMYNWRHANPQKAAAAKLRRRAMEMNAPGQHSYEDILKLYEIYTGCPRCQKEFGATLKPTIDHIVALAVGGSNDAANLQLLCKPCNSSKGAR